MATLVLMLVWPPAMAAMAPDEKGDVDDRGTGNERMIGRMPGTQEKRKRRRHPGSCVRGTSIRRVT